MTPWKHIKPVKKGETTMKSINPLTVDDECFRQLIRKWIRKTFNGKNRLARKASLSLSTINEYLNGRQPKMSTRSYIRLADAMGKRYLIATKFRHLLPPSPLDGTARIDTCPNLPLMLDLKNENHSLREEIEKNKLIYKQEIEELQMDVIAMELDRNEVINKNKELVELRDHLIQSLNLLKKAVSK
jgi:hypothetical protein